jgi:hypothetical protein
MTSTGPLTRQQLVQTECWLWGSRFASPRVLRLASLVETTRLRGSWTAGSAARVWCLTAETGGRHVWFSRRFGLEDRSASMIAGWEGHFVLDDCGTACFRAYYPVGVLQGSVRRP